MTQHISTSDGTANTASGRVRFTDSDVQQLPPFLALDALDMQVTALDDWCSNFIGRMQPYCNQMGDVPGESISADKRLDTSGLENRIFAVGERLAAIHRALDEMNGTLRL